MIRLVEVEREILPRYGDRLHECICEGFKHAQDAIRANPIASIATTPSARAHLVNCCIIHLAKLMFHDDVRAGRVEFSEQLGFAYMNIEGRVLVRFKKFGLDGMPSNIKTKQQRLIRSQTRTLFGLDEIQATWLHAGYTTDEVTQTSTELKCIVGDRVVWSVDLSPTTSAGILDISESFHDTERQRDRKARVVKKGKGKKRRKEG